MMRLGSITRTIMRIVCSPDGTSESRLDATRLAAAMDAIGVTLGGADLHELLEEGGSEESGELTLDWNGVYLQPVLQLTS